MVRSVIFLILFSIFSTISFAGDDYHFLIKVSYTSPEQNEKINQLGLDIWESSDSTFLVYARQDDLDSLNQGGIFYSVISNTKEDILKRFYQITGDTTAFHTYDELSAELFKLASTYPEICELSSIGQSWEGRQLYIMKINGDLEHNDAKPEICFIANQHAREWITEEVALGLIEHLLENYSSDTYIHNLINDTRIWIIPLANPDGKEFCHTTDRLWRKNRRNNGGGVYGVDLNRNFSYQWGLTSGGSSDSSSITYFGPAPFSEPENIAFRDFVVSHSSTLKLIVNYHSYGEDILYPWGYTYSPLSQPYLSQYQSLCSQISTKIYQVRGTRYKAGQWSVVLNYRGSGCTEDWAWHDQNIFCIGSELSPKNDPPGFVIPESEIQPTLSDVIPGALYAIQWANQLTPLDDWSLY